MIEGFSLTAAMGTQTELKNIKGELKTVVESLSRLECTRFVKDNRRRIENLFLFNELSLSPVANDRISRFK